MNAKIKKKWVAALRSGKFKQSFTGQMYNKNDDSYCVTGVLVNVILLKGFPDTPAKLSDEKLEKLIRYNDKEHKSFKWLAGYIERYC